MKAGEETSFRLPASSINPLLDVDGLRELPRLLTNREALARALRHQPFEGVDLRVLSPPEKLLLIPRLRRAFVPSPDAIQVAERLLHLIYFELDRRNPLVQSNQRFVNQAAQWLKLNVDQIPWETTQAQGMVIEGLTGIGKSHIVDRVLSLIPQVVEHFPDGQWGMQYLKHLVWLKVPMPADNSRMGLLVNVLMAMDEALGTNYATDHARSSARVERLIAVVLYLLVQHRCGLLIIEEAQKQNLVGYTRNFLAFFLRILNAGVPTVLVGNPLAFDLIKNHAQDTDRFSEGGWITLLPAFGPDTPVWQRLWIPGLWGPTVLDGEQASFEPLPVYPGIGNWAAFLWQLTGGLPRQLCRLRIEVLEAALRQRRQSVDSRFVEEVFRNSSRFAMVRDRNAALANHDAQALMAFEDVPVQLLRRYWTSNAVMPTPIAALDVQPDGHHPRVAADEATKDARRKLCRDLRAATDGQSAKPARRRSSSGPAK